NTNLQTPGHTWGGPPKIINNRLENARSVKSALRRSQTIPPKTCYLVSGLARLVDRAYFINKETKRKRERKDIEKKMLKFRYINRTSKVFQPQSLVGTVNTNLQTPGHTWGGPPKII